MSDDASDRRQGPRVRIEMWVEESNDQGELYFQRSANLSEGGMYLENTIPHSLGTIVQLQFTLPGDTQRVKVRGEIVNAEPGHFGMGIKFVDVDPTVRERIARFVGSQATRRRHRTGDETG